MSPAKKGAKPRRCPETPASRHNRPPTPPTKFGYYTDNFMACYLFDTIQEWNDFVGSYMTIKEVATGLSNHDINSAYITSWLELVDDHARRYPGEAEGRPMIPHDIRKVQVEIWVLRNMTVPADWSTYWPEYEEKDIALEESEA